MGIVNVIIVVVWKVTYLSEAVMHSSRGTGIHGAFKRSLMLPFIPINYLIFFFLDDIFQFTTINYYFKSDHR